MTRDIFGNVARVRNLASQRFHDEYWKLSRRRYHRANMWSRVHNRLREWQERAGAYRHPELLQACPKEAP